MSKLITCLEFQGEGVSSSSIEPEISASSNQELHISDLFLTDKSFPKIKIIYYKLQYSQRREVFYIKATLPVIAGDQRIFYLQCHNDIRGFFRHVSGEINSEVIDRLINKAKIQLYFNFENDGLSFYLLGKRCELKNILLAIDENFLDQVFYRNPNILTLVNELQSECDNHLFVTEVCAFLMKGFINPAREHMLSERERLKACPAFVQDRLIKSLFSRYNISFSL